jgi:hypothetical protein
VKKRNNSWTEIPTYRKGIRLAEVRCRRAAEMAVPRWSGTRRQIRVCEPPGRWARQRWALQQCISKSMCCCPLLLVYGVDYRNGYSVDRGPRVRYTWYIVLLLNCGGALVPRESGTANGAAADHGVCRHTIQRVWNEGVVMSVEESRKPIEERKTIFV